MEWEERKWIFTTWVRIRAHDELTLFGHCCPYCDCGGGREKEGKYITAVPAGVINNQCNPMLIATPGRAVSLCQWARQKTVYVTTVYASQTYRTSRNRSNRMWISKQSNWKGKPRRESGFRAITISCAASLLTKTALDLDILMSQTWSWHLDRWRCPLVCRYLSRNRFLGSSSKLLQAPPSERGLAARKATTINVTSSSVSAPDLDIYFPSVDDLFREGLFWARCGWGSTTSTSARIVFLCGQI